MTTPRRRLALLDRDGTIIVDKVYLADPAGVEFTPGAPEGLRLLRDAGYDLVLITNQSGIARGYFGEAELKAVHDRLESLLAEEGLRLAAIHVCPHGPADGCGCRKPAPGMVLAALAQFGAAAEDAVFLGDSDADMGAAAAAGVAAIRIGAAKGDERAAPDVLAAARSILAGVGA